MEESKMYFKNAESNERPVSMSYEKLPNGQAAALTHFQTFQDFQVHM